MSQKTFPKVLEGYGVNVKEIQHESNGLSSKTKLDDIKVDDPKFQSKKHKL